MKGVRVGESATMSGEHSTRSRRNPKDRSVDDGPFQMIRPARGEDWKD
jgi:hypothetical protein